MRKPKDGGEGARYVDGVFYATRVVASFGWALWRMSKHPEGYKTPRLNQPRLVRGSLSGRGVGKHDWRQTRVYLHGARGQRPFEGGAVKQDRSRCQHRKLGCVTPVAVRLSGHGGRAASSGDDECAEIECLGLSDCVFLQLSSHPSTEICRCSSRFYFSPGLFREEACCRVMMKKICVEERW
ncbi:hypothetical protein BV25DRAFT_957369 [Artomyces pyxidatus]|uniref:Uncharacterized protein n=1 Tax=Artomyces pyxidatus TaxID=48021 RepID=A0ACB8SW32_9AGAM|nr:hypothetical protein BV25DRAFT_957369 [Artomyces pyxidatus]